MLDVRRIEPYGEASNRLWSSVRKMTMSGGRCVAADDNTRETAKNVAATKRIVGGFVNEIFLMLPHGIVIAGSWPLAALA